MNCNIIPQETGEAREELYLYHIPSDGAMLAGGAGLIHDSGREQFNGALLAGGVGLVQDSVRE